MTSDLRKGICYGNDAFPFPYTPSTSVDTQVFFGSDPSASYCGGLWGADYRSAGGSQCGAGTAACRADLDQIKAMGAQVLRLYDWDPRNDHIPFLDACAAREISVLVSVSNYFLQPAGGLPNAKENIANLIRSYSKDGDYHPAVAGIVIGNELEGHSVRNLADFTNEWISIEEKQFPKHRKVRLGHPLAFVMQGGLLPCWGYWNELLPLIRAQVGERLFLAPQTYNDAKYLFRNADGHQDADGHGWTQLTYKEYGLPIWFTEIGQDRTKADFEQIVGEQLHRAMEYARMKPGELIGACFFSFADKSWKQENPPVSEGSFGAYTHTSQNHCVIEFDGADFTHWEAPALGSLAIDVLKSTPLHDVVSRVYHSDV